MYSFKCRNDIKNKLKGVSESQSKHFEFEDYKKKFRWRGIWKKLDNYILKSIDHE